MQQYVCLRITRMDDVNLSLFEYDRYNTLYFFMLNADEHIYMRYGGRDTQSQDTYLSLDSLALALQKGLDLHARYQKGELKRVPPPKAIYAKEIPLLVERTFARNQCVECHLIGDFLAQQSEQAGTLDKLAQMFRSPDIRTIGIELDVPKGLAVKEARGAAAAAGLRAGDTVASVNGTDVWTFADLQYALDKTPRMSKSLTLGADRDGKRVALTVQLPERWWWTDIRYKQLTVDPRVYFESTPIDESEKKQLGLGPKSFASRVTYVSSMASAIQAHELKQGDIITAVDGVATDEVAHTADAYLRLRKTAGDTAKLTVLRDGKPLEMKLTTFRISFRK